MGGRKHTSHRGIWIIAVILGLTTLFGMEEMHWTFLRTEEILIGGVLICIAIEIWNHRR